MYRYNCFSASEVTLGDTGNCTMRNHKNWWYLHNKWNTTRLTHDDVIKWKYYPRYWPFVWGIHRSAVNSLHKGQWRGSLMFSLICAWINGWLNNGEAGDLRCHRTHYDVTVIVQILWDMVLISWVNVLICWKCGCWSGHSVHHFSAKFISENMERIFFSFLSFVDNEVTQLFEITPRGRQRLFGTPFVHAV